MKKTVTFACVNYNGSEYTERWLRSVSRQSVGLGEVVRAIVVDNGSAPDDVERVARCVSVLPETRLVHSPENRGYFAGLNVAIQTAPADPAEYWVVGNNDLEFAEDFAARLLSKTYEEDVLVVAPNVVTASGAPQNPHSIGRLSKARRAWIALYFSSYAIACASGIVRRAAWRWRGRRRAARQTKSGRIYMGIGACYVLCPEYRRRCGKLPEDVFMYGEEALLAAQVARASGATYFDQELCVAHAEEGSVRLVPSRRVYEWGRDSYPRYRDFL